MNLFTRVYKQKKRLSNLEVKKPLAVVAGTRVELVTSGL